MHPVIFSIGNFEIYSYGLFVLLGLVIAYIFLLQEKKRYQIDSQTLSDLLFWILISGFITSRIFYILLNFSSFTKNPWDYILSRSGFVFFAGLLGGILGATIFITAKKLKFLNIADMLAPAIAIGHSLGRIGCFFYGCCYGKICTLPICVKFPFDSPAGESGQPVLPTQLISAFFLVIIFSVLLYIRDKKKFDGEVFFNYLLLYGTFRFTIEFFRADTRGIFFYLTTSQWFSIISMGIGIVFIISNNFKLKQK